MSWRSIKFVALSVAIIVVFLGPASIAQVSTKDSGSNSASKDSHKVISEFPSIRFPAKTNNITWHQVESGYQIARVQLGYASYLISSELLVIKIDPKKFDITLARASDYGKDLMSIRDLTNKGNALIGINTHFFDPDGKPLGLLVRDSKIEHRLQKGGSVLTGLFTLTKGAAKILHRSDFSNSKVPELGLQSGPRLIENGKKVSLRARAGTSRRSGIATTRSGEVLLFATFLRFPGATLQQIQDFLLKKELQVKNALNLDGGGSSQLFVTSNSASQGDIYISGGDPVPVGLLIKRK